MNVEINDINAINAYTRMDISRLAALAYHMEKTLRQIQLRQCDDPAVLAGVVVVQAITEREGR